MAWNPLSRFTRAKTDAPSQAAAPEPSAPEGQSLVPDRECGGCTACCEVLAITAPDLKKPPAVLCQHCDAGGGCRIYASRPAVCRNFLCGWRYLGMLEDIWRPDRSHIIITFPTDHIPPQYTQEHGIQFELFGDARSTISWPPFVGYVMELVRNGMPVFLQVTSEPGFEAMRLFLNDRLVTSAALRDYARAILDLTMVLAECESAVKRRWPGSTQSL